MVMYLRVFTYTMEHFGITGLVETGYMLYIGGLVEIFCCNLNCKTLYVILSLSSLAGHFHLHGSKQ